ncbi:MAG: 7TM receptor with intracellular metal dependent [Planctomycetota bacterium]|nr:MAG: 7TM receptor with intracellular metal dependent [Planctomycetota bacterium]
MWPWRSKPRRFSLTRQGPSLPVETMERSPIAFNVLAGTLFTLGTVAILSWTPLRPSTGTFRPVDAGQVWLRLAGHLVLSSLAAAVTALALSFLAPTLRRRPAGLFAWGFTLVALFASVRVFEAAGWPLELVPVTLAGMILAVGLGPGLAFANILAFTLLARLTGILTGDEYHAVLALFPGSVIAVFGMRTLRRRSRALNVGLLAGLVHAAGLIGIHLVIAGDVSMREHIRFVQTDAARGFLNGVATAFVVTGLLPFLERAFKITTELSLLELADFNQPLLKKLSLEAPGTHYHSIRVSELAEAAVAEIGGNALLARVGCLYHDIGKTNKPEYFVENDPQAGARHKSLSPAMSTLIIKAHVKDGVEMAEYYGLPQEVLDFITSHHGTMMIEFFYRQAMAQAEEAGTGDSVDAESFRYAGPKPQTRETAVAMIADGVEAAARTLTDPTPSKLEGLVRSIAMVRLNDGQLNECPLTMQELEKVVASFVRTLVGIYHSRVRYPNQKPDTDHEQTTRRTASTPPRVAERP